MNEIGISYPVGLGDGVIMAGAVWYLLTKYDRVHIACHASHEASIRAIHEDAGDRVVIYPISDSTLIVINNVRRFIHTSAPTYLLEECCSDIPTLNCLKHIDVSTIFPVSWYHSIGMEYSVRWLYNPIPKLQDRYTAPSPIDDPYIFVHDDTFRAINIDMSLFPRGYRVIRPTGHNNILEYIPLILGAAELHFADSSFLHLIRSMVGLEMPIYFHEYAKPGASFRRRRTDTLDAVTDKGWGVYEQDPLYYLVDEPDCELEIVAAAADGTEMSSTHLYKDEYFKLSRERRELGNFKPIDLQSRKIDKQDFSINMIYVKRENEIIRRCSILPIHMDDSSRMNIHMPIHNLWI